MASSTAEVILLGRWLEARAKKQTGAAITALMGLQARTVRAVQVDIPTKQVRVDYDEALVDVNRMKAVLQEEDYPVQSVA